MEARRASWTRERRHRHPVQALSLARATPVHDVHERHRWNVSHVPILMTIREAQEQMVMWYPNKLRVSTLLLILATAACGEEALVSYSFATEADFPVEGLFVEFRDGEQTRLLTSADFGGPGHPRTPEFSTRDSGTLRTRFWYVAGVDTVFSGAFDLELHPDFRWGVSFARATADPTLQCFGCAGRLVFPIDAQLQTTPEDSLWVVWSGNSISDPVVF